MKRKEAIAAGLTQYNTGKPCKRGHMSYRYASSGACAACVNGAAADARVTTAATMRQHKTERGDALANITPIKVRCWLNSAHEVREIAVSLCLGQYPHLTRGDVSSAAAPTDVAAGTGKFTLMVPLDQVELMVEIAKAMFDAVLKANPPDTSHVTRGLAIKMRELETVPPAWTEKP